MTIRDIQHHLAATISTELSRETISKITDAVEEEVSAWQNRPLDECYPVIVLDAIRLKIRLDHQAATRAAHIAVRVDRDGITHVLGIWADDNEEASFWASVCAQLANRGIKDILIAAGDRLTGLPETIEATWPQAMVHTCVVHLIRAANRFVSYGDRKTISAALHNIYTAPTEQVAREARDQFAASELGKHYPSTVKTWEDAWERCVPLLAFPPAVRKVIYTTNTIDSLNYQLRKVTKNPDHFPSTEAAVKPLWLAITTIEDKRAREPVKDEQAPSKQAKSTLIEGPATTGRKHTLAQPATAYPDQFNLYL